MKVKIGQILASQGPLAKLLGGEGADGTLVPAPNVSAQMGWNLHLLRKALVEQIEIFNAERAKIVEYREQNSPAQDDDSDEAAAKRAEVMGEANRRFSELLDVEVTLATVGRIRLSALEKENVQLTAQDFAMLEWLIKPDLPSIFEDDEA